MLSLDEQIEQADVIFLGVVEKSDPVPNERSICTEYSKDNPKCGARLATFAITRSWKGDATGELQVFTSDGCYCTGSGYLYTVGAKVLVFASRKPAGGAKYFDKGSCSGTREINSAEQQQFLRILDQKLKN